ncbi:MAG: FecR domain-containing protein [Saprospiraceae bacterium]|nr:FecR domain-containing protein [Saprospiraceae bacterium]
MEGRKDEPISKPTQAGTDPLEQIWNWTGDYTGKFNPDTDAAWQRFKAERVKGHSPLRIVRRPVQRWWSYAAAVLLLIGGAGIWKTYLQKPAMLVVQSTDIQREVLLADGTTVVLNSGSELRYPANIDAASSREVELTGEAYFDVAHDAGRRFVIHTSAADVAVLGTAFNLRAVPQESTVEVEVEKGMVELRATDGTFAARIKPRQRGVYNPGAGISIQKEPALNALSWRTGKLVFVARPVREVIKEIGRYYGASIDLSASDIGDCLFTSNFDKVPLNRALDAISTVYGAKVVKKDAAHFVFKGGKCSR